MVLVVVETLFQDFLEKELCKFYEGYRIFATIISETEFVS